jgi:phospholipid transport system substrate-binding protein
MKLKKFLTYVSFIIINLTIINNSYSIEPDIFVQSTVNRASQTLSDNLSKEEKIKKLKKIAKETVDIQGIGMYTLGSYRKVLSENQKKEYSVLFEQYFLKTFSSRLAEYSNPEIEVKTKEKLNKNYTMVKSVLVATDQRPEVNIDWRIYTKNPNDLKIRDLIIEGLSLVRTQKEEFSSIIESNNGDINSLLTSLKKFIK